MFWKTILTAGAWLSFAAAYAGNYYLSPDGNDDNRGDRNSPWRTIAKANKTLEPGDTVFFAAGAYDGSISPAKSGLEGQPIAYIAEKPGEVFLNGGYLPVYSMNLAIGLYQREYIIIDGFSVRDVKDMRWLRIRDVKNCEFRNLHFEGASVEDPIMCRDSGFNRFENIYAGRAGFLGPSGMVSGDMWNNYNCSNNVFSGLYITRAGHRPFGFWFDCEYNVVRDSVFDCRWGRNFEFFSSKKMLIERCVITNCYDGASSADSAAKLFILDSIFRNNLIFRNQGAPLAANAYQYGDLPTFGIERSRMYGNTFYRNLDFGFSMVDNAKEPDPHTVHGNILKNNIFADNNPGGDGVALRVGGNIAMDNLIINNLMTGSDVGQQVVRITWTENLRLTVEEANRTRPHFRDNFDADPKFIDPANDDFNLSPGSPAIDRGAALAKVTADSDGRIIAVDDAGSFYDGFGIPGETGDSVFIGKGKIAARVIRRDIDGNILELDRAVAVRAGDSVNLPYAGGAPDLGAFESGMAGGPVIPPNLRDMDKEAGRGILVQSGFEEENLEEWFYLWSFTRQPNSYVTIDDGTAAAGRRSIKVYYVKNRDDVAGSALSLLMRAAWWDIDKYPQIEFAYRIPEGVPVGVALYPFDGKFEANGIFIAGSPALNPGKGAEIAGKYELTADGEWHTVTMDARKIRAVVPEVKHLRTIRFYTNGNGKDGDCYWIDDFMIRP